MGIADTQRVMRELDQSIRPTAADSRHGQGDAELEMICEAVSQGHLETVRLTICEKKRAFAAKSRACQLRRRRHATALRREAAADPCRFRERI